MDTEKKIIIFKGGKIVEGENIQIGDIVYVDIDNEDEIKLIDSPGMNTKREKAPIRVAVFGRAGSGKSVFLHFAGHGREDRRRDGGILFEPSRVEIEKLQRDLSIFKEEFREKFETLKVRNQQQYNFSHELVSTNNLIEEFITSHIYIDTDDKEIGQNIYDKFKDFAESIGFDIKLEDEPKMGSFIGRFIAKIKDIFKSDRTKELLKDGEHALKLAMIDKVQSEIDINQATAAAKLLEASKDVTSCVLQIGSLVYVKYENEEGKPVQLVRTLRRSEMKAISENPELLNSPFEMVKVLTQVKAANSNGKISIENQKKIRENANKNVRVEEN